MLQQVLYRPHPRRQESVNPTGRDIATMPLFVGGMGFRSAVRKSPSAYWAGWAHCLAMIGARHPDLAVLMVHRRRATRTVADEALSSGQRSAARERDGFEPGGVVMGGPSAERQHRGVLMAPFTDSGSSQSGLWGRSLQQPPFQTFPWFEVESIHTVPVQTFPPPSPAVRTSVAVLSTLLPTTELHVPEREVVVVVVGGKGEKAGLCVQLTGQPPRCVVKQYLQVKGMVSSVAPPGTASCVLPSGGNHQRTCTCQPVRRTREWWRT